MATVLSFIINVVILLFVLGLLITIHELGHFIAAKLSGVKVEDFAIGMGPTIFRKKYKGTEYRLNLLPIGGYVNILGEVVDDKEISQKMKDDPNSFQNKNVFIKTFILSAGVLMNFFTAVVIYYVFLALYGFSFLFPTEVVNYQPIFGTVETEIFGPVEYTSLIEDGNAISAGWPDKGYIKSVGESESALSEIEITGEFADFVSSRESQEIFAEICSDKDLTECETYSVNVSNDGLAGVVMNTNSEALIIYKGWERWAAGFVHSINMIQLAGVHIGNIFNEASDTGDYSTAVNTFSGPVGLYFIVDFLRELGIGGILDLIANLSLTLFVMNIIPIPALDGGRIVLAILEEIMGDKFNKEIEAWLIRGSFILLMVFMLAVILKDIVFIDTLRNLF